MNVLFVGDVHNHLYMFDDVQRLDKKYNFDRIVFLGDYVDDWNTNNQDSLKTLKKVFELKESNLDKYTFCIGNHECSYLGFPCSGYQSNMSELVRLELIQNIDKIDLYTEVKIEDKIYICSHAGFTNSYICNVLDTYGEYEGVLKQFQENKLNSLQYLKYCSKGRGGYDPYSSFIWADRHELTESAYWEKPLIQNQIVGHTPVKSIHEEKVEDSFNFYFTDTHSTYRDGSEFGDKSYLAFIDNKKNILY